MSEKLILRKEFIEYKSHIVGDLNISISLSLYLKGNNKRFLCDTSTEVSEDELIDEKKSNINCEKCIENYHKIMGIIEEEKKMTPTQKLLMAFGSHLSMLNNSFSLRGGSIKKSFEKYESE